MNSSLYTFDNFTTSTLINISITSSIYLYFNTTSTTNVHYDVIHKNVSVHNYDVIYNKTAVDNYDVIYENVSIYECRDEEEELELKCDRLKYSPLATALLATITSLVALTTIVGNMLVIAAFATDKKLRMYGNYFILNLAVSDLIVGLLIVVYTPYLLKGCWQLTRVGCLTFLFLDYVVPLASAWSMALISLDRFCCVALPIPYRVYLNTYRAVLLMLIPWLAGALWYGPTVLFWAQITGRQKVPPGTCIVEFFDHAPYLITSSLVEFVLPFVTVATINILIYLNIRRRSDGLRTVNNDENNLRSARAKLLLARDKKSARSLSILIVVFLITWAPFEVCSFVNPICNFCIPDSAFDVVFWLLWLNSTINPILYPFLQQRFRIAFLRLLCSCHHRESGMHRVPSRTRSERSIATTPN